MVPGQGLIEEPATQVKVRVDAVCGKSLLPEIEAELVSPAVKATAQVVGGQQRRGQTPVATSEHALEKREPSIVPFELDTIASQSRAQEFLASFGLFQTELSRPLKRGVRFRNKSRDTGCDLATMLTSGRHLATEINDTQQVFLGLARQAQHEVELDALPAQTKKHACCLDQFFLFVLLLDHITQPLRAGFRG